RDPWTEWGLWDSLMVSSPARWLHRRLERRVLATADEIITITPFYVKRFEQLSGRKVALLTNGFDAEDFKGMIYSRADTFVIRHAGIVNEKCDPRPFMNALKKEMDADPVFKRDLKVEFVGDVHPDFISYVSNIAALKETTFFTGNVPHDDLIHLYGSSSMLLLILTGYKDAEGFLPGKLFEYIATGLPVLGVGPPASDAATLLQETGAGIMVETGDEPAIRQAIRAVYEKWRRSESPAADRAKIEKYSRRGITRQLSALLAAG
ncbi:MAG TPA: glycosyltransferase, partial [Chryseosolibacter sp.]